MNRFSDDDLDGPGGELANALCDECKTRKATRMVTINGTRQCICMHCLVTREDPLQDALQCSCGELPKLQVSEHGLFIAIICPNEINCGKSVGIRASDDKAADTKILVDGWNMALKPFQ